MPAVSREVRHRQIKIAVRQPLLNLIVAALNEFTMIFGQSRCIAFTIGGMIARLRV